jgi:hypothetical protein
MIQRMVARNDQLEAQRDEMIHTLAQVVPLIKQATEVLNSRLALDKEIVNTHQEVCDVLREVKWTLTHQENR